MSWREALQPVPLLGRSGLRPTCPVFSPTWQIQEQSGEGKESSKDQQESNGGHVVCQGSNHKVSFKRGDV